jgi:16S rRNA (adenine1518-N6/adenine1519-N6)-dimethyltransferase
VGAAMKLAPLQIGAILRQHDLHLKKSLGQNFLTSENILEAIVQASGVKPEETVLEIGPGIGSLTRHLAVNARRVVAVELDANLIPVLEDILTPYNNVEIVHGDILKVDLPHLLGDAPYLVVANIPYYITSAVIRRCLENPTKPQKMILTVQKEVARRICQQPGDLSLLALSVQVYGQPKILFDIPAGAFYPPPNVDSSVLCINLYDQPLIAQQDLEQFFRWIKAGFSQKRKKLRNSLSAGLSMTTIEIEQIFAAANIDPQRRAETLSIEEWQQIITVEKETR